MPLSPTAVKLQTKLFRPEDHPYRAYEREMAKRLRADHVLLEAGCGRTAPVLRQFARSVKMAIGIDCVSFAPDGVSDGVMLIRNDLHRIALADDCVDMVSCRSVLEHVEQPLLVFREVRRILKSGGHFVFLTPNLWDYASLVSLAVPNRFHPFLVSRVQGRDEEDTFPTHYKTNTFRQVSSLAENSDMELVLFQHLGQYPSYLMFNPVLFLLGTAYEKVLERVRCLGFLRSWILAVIRKPL